MKKIIKNLLPIFFILINTINIFAITYEELEEEQRITYNSLINCYKENARQDFIKILATGKNFELINVTESSLVKTIKLLKTPNIDSFIHILYKYSILGEIVQQVKAGTRIKRFHKICKYLEIYLEHNIPIFPHNIEQILSLGRTTENPNSFLWYFSEEVVGNNNILNPCLEESLSWFVNKTYESAFNGNIKLVIKNLEMVPFMIKMKYQDLSFKEAILEIPHGEIIDTIVPIIENIEERFEQRRPSKCTAILRYRLF